MTYQLTKEDAEKINGKEIMVKLPDFNKPYHAVVLSKEGIGTSVKPYFIDEKEKEDYINLIMDVNDWWTDDVYIKIKSMIEHPTYCWLFSPPKVPFEEILSLIDDLEKESELSFKDDPRVIETTPTCPFYK